MGRVCVLRYISFYVGCPCGWLGRKTHSALRSSLSPYNSAPALGVFFGNARDTANWNVRE
jgi:hypothetical protein